MAIIAAFWVVITFLFPHPFSASEYPDLWRGLVVAEEHRCSPYVPADYSYPQSLEPQIVAAMQGFIYSPYTTEHFESTSETDIEHIVARSEAHDSGLCAATPEIRRAFASDLLNLTLASPALNRGQKGAKDAGGWLPPANQCWFADRVVRVRREYSLTIDWAEATALDGVLAACWNDLPCSRARTLCYYSGAARVAVSP